MEMYEQLFLHADYQTALTDSLFVEIRVPGKRLDLKQLRFQNQTLKGQDRQCTRCADKSLARPGRKETTATEDFEFRISYL